MVTIAQYKRDIREAMTQNGKFTHNVISCALRCVKELYGVREANKIVVQFELTRRYGIRKEPIEEKKP